MSARSARLHGCTTTHLVPPIDTTVCGRIPVICIFLILYLNKSHAYTGREKCAMTLDCLKKDGVIIKNDKLMNITIILKVAVLVALLFRDVGRPSERHGI